MSKTFVFFSFIYIAKKKKSGSTGGSSGGKIDTSLGDGMFDLKSVKDEMGNHVQKLKEELHNKYQPTLTVGKYIFFIRIIFSFTFCYSGLYQDA